VLGTPDRLIGADLVEDPYPFYARLRAEAPVWRIPGSDAFLVSTWELVTEATARVEELSNNFRHIVYRDDAGGVAVMETGDGGAPDVFAGADPPMHTAHRKLFFPELMQQRVARLDTEIARLADDMLDGLLGDGGGDAATDLANPIPMRVMTDHVIGFRGAEVAQTQHWVFAGSRFMGGRLGLGEMAAVGAEAGGLLPWVEHQLDAVMHSPGGNDVLSAAAGGVRDGVLSRDQAAFTLMVLLGAGGETTTSLIGNAIRILAERPHLQDDLRADLDAVPPFVEEVLRYEAPFRFHPRTARCAVELGGVEIPERAMVALMWGAANRDGSVFDEPDELIVGRPNAHLHVGFGRGIHHCVGAALARLEARVVLARLLERSTRFALDPDDPPCWVDSLWIRRHERLPIVLESARQLGA